MTAERLAAPKFMNLAQAAAYLGIAMITLRIWLREKRAPKHYMFTNRYKFLKEDLDAWILQQGK